MSALKCLACRHENKADEKFCEACGSSLDLKFCPGCEAVNGRTATHCRSCAAELPAESAGQGPAPQMPEPPEAPVDQPFRAPQRWRVIEPEYSRGKRMAVWTARFFGAVSLVGLGALAYHFYGQWAPILKTVAAAATVAVTPVAPTPPVAPAPAPKRPVAEVKPAPKATVAQGAMPVIESRSPAPAPERPIAEVKPAPKPTVAQGVLPGVESRAPAPAAPAASAVGASGERQGEPTVPAPAPAPERPVAEVKQAPKATVAKEGLPGVESLSPAPAERTVTHTQATGTASATAPVEFKQANDVLPPPPVRSRGVTHTRPGPAAASAEPVQAEVVPTLTNAPAAPAKAASAACPEAVAVLGLCSANVKGGN